MKIQRIYESHYYQEARDNRFTLHDVDYCECTMAEYEESIEEFQSVKSKLSFLSKNLRRAANRGSLSQPVEIDLDYLFEIGENQFWECALTGDNLEFTRGGYIWLGKWCNPQSCTIDRIDSSKGYIKGNVQLVTWEANCLKQSLDNDVFIEFCNAVTANN